MKDKIKVNTHTHTYTFQLALFSFAHLCDCCYCCYEVSFHFISKQHWEWEISFFFVRYSIITNHFQKLIFVTNFLIVNWQPNKCGLKTRCVCACAHINSIVEFVDFYKMGLASLTTSIHSLFLCVCVCLFIPRWNVRKLKIMVGFGWFHASETICVNWIFWHILWFF